MVSQNIYNNKKRSQKIKYGYYIMTSLVIVMTGCVQNSENDFPETKVTTESRKYEKISADSRGTHFYGEGDINLDAGSRGSWFIHSRSTDNGYGWQDDIVNQDGQRFQREGHSSNSNDPFF